MRDLEALQEQFQSYLLQQPSSIENDIIATAKVPAAVRLAIYQNAYYSRLLEVLQQDFAELNALLGEEMFSELAHNYIEAHPSRYKSVRWFGSYLPHFLQLTAPYNESPWLYELALFEWTLIQAFDACDQPVLTIEEMAAIAPEKWADMRFILQASFSRLNLHWNVVSFWKEKENKPSLQASEQAIDWVVWRMGQDVQFYSLSADQAYMLDAMADNQDFGTICAGLCTWVKEEEVALHAAQLLKRFIADQMITMIKWDD